MSLITQNFCMKKQNLFHNSKSQECVLTNRNKKGKEEGYW